MSRTLRTMTLVAIALLVAVAGCADSDDDAHDTARGGDGGEAGIEPTEGDRSDAATVDPESGPATTVAATDDAAPSAREVASDSDGEAGSGATVDSGSGDVGGVDLQTVAAGRQIIRTGAMTIEVDDVVEAGRRAIGAVDGFGGVVFGQDTVTDPRPRTVFTFKVLPEDFDAARAALAEIGDVVEQTVSVDDVTDRVVDLQSRIVTAEASVARLRALLDRAGSVQDIAALESQLLQRETDLETLRGQLRTVQDQVAQATIIATIVEAVEPEPRPAMEVTASGFVGTGDTTVCPGDEALALTGDTDVTLCVSVENTGDTALTDVAVSSTGIDLEPEEFSTVAGDASEVRPGDDVVFATEVRVDEEASVAFSASATPEGDDEPIGGRAGLRIELDRPTTLPGLGDSLERGWGAMATLFGVLLVVVGVVVPFSWLLAIVAGIWWFRRRRAPEAIA